MMTPEEATAKHAKNLKASLTEITAGVDRVTENPMEKAALKADNYVAGITKAVQDGKWQRGLRRVSLDQWKNAMKTKGIPRISAGIDQAKDKMTSFYKEVFPHIENLQTQIAGMPDNTLDDSINRMITFTRGMANFKRSK